MNKALHISPIDINAFYRQTMSYAAQFEDCTAFDNNNITNIPSGAFPKMVAFGAKRKISYNGSNSFNQIQEYHQKHQCWLVGHLAYDLKNEIENLSSQNDDTLKTPLFYFYEPQHLITFDNEEVSIQSDNPELLLENINKHQQALNSSANQLEFIQSRTSKNEYIDTVNKLKKHILEGDIYEINYCIEFLGQYDLKPLEFYFKLKEISPTPFSVFYKFDNQHFNICASPERFIKKHHNTLTSQPIKGTAPRGSSFEEDQRNIQLLKTDEKELAENMMIVDLVRNDLAKSCKSGSVVTDEMFGIYSFKQVHQMISTIKGALKPEIHFVEAIKNAFPMGSMTGAPKIKVMQLAEHYEASRRGLYSGTIGYITPEGNFDFNVVIRSLLYNSSSKRLSFHVGSAITYDSKPEKEYEECLLKAKALLSCLGSPKITNIDN